MGVEDVVQPFFKRLLELRPVDATYLGLHEHDGRLPEGTLAAAAEEIDLMERFRDDVLESPAEGLDREAALYFAELNLFWSRDVKLWQSMAEAPDQIGTGIFLLFARDTWPLEERLESISARVEAIPAYLASSRERLLEPVRLFNEIALESARQLTTLLVSVLEAAPDPQRPRLERAMAAAGDAIADYCGWLEHDVLPAARPEFALGEESFARLLQLRRLPAGPDQLLSLGRDYLAEVKEQRARLVSATWPGRSLPEVEATVRGKHPDDFEAALNTYRDTIRAAREFVTERGLASVPSRERLEVIETPVYLRHVLPFAAYEPAAYFDREQLGIYVVTPPSATEGLGEHNLASIVNTSVHEGYPGHHLQFVCANQNRSLARLLGGFLATEFIEGWAHYCEELMYEEGFSSGPEVRFIQLTDLIWRACRVVIDVELSCGRMSFGEAVEMLVGEAGMGRPQAEAEVRRYTFTPGYQLSYLYGKHLLGELRQRERARLGSDFELRGFHDQLLYAGALPAALWDRVLAGD